MLAQRRKLLQYLRRADFDAYAKMLSALGLKDRYMKQVIPYVFCTTRLGLFWHLQRSARRPCSSSRPREGQCQVLNAAIQTSASCLPTSSLHAPACSSTWPEFACLSYLLVPVSPQHLGSKAS